MTTTNVYIPYSQRSFDGIKKDVLFFLESAGYREARVIALVLDGEKPPVDDYITVAHDGSVPSFVDESARHFIVCNGGLTALTIGAVNIALTTKGTLINVQRDGVQEMCLSKGE